MKNHHQLRQKRAKRLKAQSQRANRIDGAAHSAVRRSFAKVEPFNAPLAQLAPPSAIDIARQIAPARDNGPRVRTANFAAILASDPLDVVAARVTSRARRGDYIGDLVATPMPPSKGKPS